MSEGPFAEAAGASSTRFEIRRRLGEGGMGVVFEAFDRERDEAVALKTLERLDGAAVYRLKKEFRALAGLVHPNLVRLHELFADGARCFFTMERVEGSPLVEHLRGVDPTGRTLTNDDAELRRVFAELAAGISAIHRANKIHRDLKPSNVLVRKDGRVVILDFGLASPIEGDKSRDLALAGTPAYMAPEQLQPGGAVPASDWYALGAMLYEAISGQLPFEGSIAKVIADKQLGHAPRPVREIAPHAAEDLAELAMALLEHDLATRAGEREVVRCLGGASAPEPMEAPAPLLVGRDAELDTLRSLFGRVEAGEPQVVRVRGPSGIGKTALVERFLDELRGAATVLRGRCYEREVVLFKSLDAIVDALSRHLVELGRDAARYAPRSTAELCRVFPVLERVPAFADHAASSVQDPLEIRRRAFAALKETLARLGDREPLVLFVDDLQWGDADSAAFFAELVTPPDPPRLLLIVSYRSGEDQAPSVLGDEVIELAPIDEGAARELARRLTGDDRRAEAIAAEAEGNPFFLAELARARSLEAGATLADVVLARASSLPDEARTLLEVVALAGGPLSRAVALRAAGLDAANDAAVPLLTSASLLRTNASGALEAYHDRIRETVAASLDADRARAHHAAIARALERASSPPAARLAMHFFAAGERERARAWAYSAAERAREGLAVDRAAALYEQALDLTDDGPTSSERGELELAIAESLANAGRGADAAEVFLRAAEHLPEERATDCRRRAASELLHCGDIEGGMRIARPLLADAGFRVPRSTAMAYARAIVTMFGTIVAAWLYARFGLGPLRRARERADPRDLRRIDLGRALGISLLLVEYGIGFYLLAAATWSALWSGDRTRHAYVLHGAATWAGLFGMARLAQRLEQTARSFAVDDADAKLLAWAPTGAIVSRFGAGEFRRVIDAADPAITTLQRLPDSSAELSYVQAIDTWARCHAGDLREVAIRAPALARAARARGNLWMETAMNASVTVLARLVVDDSDAARRDADDLSERWPNRDFIQRQLWYCDARVHIDLYRGELDERFFDAIDEAFAPWVFPTPYLVVMVGSWRCRLELALADRDPAGRPERLRRARKSARTARRAKIACAPAIGDLLLACVAFAEGDRDRSARLLAQTIASADARGLPLYAAVAKHRLASLREGDERERLLAEADAYMREQGVRRPDRFFYMFAPGFGE